MEPILVAERLTKWYGKRLAVDEVSFDIRPGEVMGLLGPNGSGKSTVLRVLAGYLQPTSGTARIGGFDVVRQGLEARRQVGYVPEDVPLYPGMQVGEFLNFMGRLRGLEGAALASAASTVCEQLSLQRERNVLIAKLSRGYRQRVAIAQALLGNPRLLILDEPTNGLDPRQIIELRDLIRSLAGACSILVTSHVLSEIERVANRAAILLDGRLLAVQQLKRDGEPVRLRVRVHARDLQAAGTCLEGVAGVLSAQFVENVESVGTWHVDAADASTAERVAAALARAEFGIREIAAAPSDLETQFLRLTSQGAQQ